MGLTELLELGARQHGVVSVACARACDVPSSTFHDTVRREGWRRVGRGVVLLPGAAANEHARIVAALLSVGGEVTACAWTAAYLHALVRRAPAATQLWVPPPRRDRRGPHVEVRRCATLQPEDVTEVDGIRVTTLPRTVVDLAGSVSADRLRMMAIEARHRERDALESLRALWIRLPSVPGRAGLGAVLEELEGDGSESGFELMTRQRLVEAGMPPSGQQERVVTEQGAFRIDIAYRPEKVGIECVGFAYHGSRSQFEDDVARGNAIVSADDWIVLRLTWRMLHGAGWDRFLRTLGRVLARRRRRPFTA